jgi:hypothetical protein
LAIELTEAAGTGTELISSIAIYQGFVAIERGPHEFRKPEEFNLDDHIVRRPPRMTLNLNTDLVSP